MCYLQTATLLHQTTAGSFALASLGAMLHGLAAAAISPLTMAANATRLAGTTAAHLANNVAAAASHEQIVGLETISKLTQKAATAATAAASAAGSTLAIASRTIGYI